MENCFDDWVVFDRRFLNLVMLLNQPQQVFAISKVCLEKLQQNLYAILTFPKQNIAWLLELVEECR